MYCALYQAMCTPFDIIDWCCNKWTENLLFLKTCFFIFLLLFFSQKMERYRLFGLGIGSKSYFFGESICIHDEKLKIESILEGMLANEPAFMLVRYHRNFHTAVLQPLFIFA